MLCVDGRAKAILDQFEEENGKPPKLKDLKEQLTSKLIFLTHQRIVKPRCHKLAKVR